MEPIQYLRILRRRWRLIASAIAIALVAAFITAPEDPGPPVRTFTARHTMILSGSGSGGQTLAQMALLTTVGEVPRRVAERLDTGESPASLASQIEAGADSSLGVLRIKSDGRDPQRVTLLANTFAEELKKFLDEDAVTRREAAIAETSSRMEALQAGVRDLDARIAATQSPSDKEVLRAERDAQVRQYSVAYERFQQLASTEVQTGVLNTLEEASPVITDSGGFQPPSSKTARMGIAFFVALLAGIALALVLERLDTKIRTKRATEESFGLPVIAEVPVVRRSALMRNRVLTHDSPESMVAEAYRALRTSLLFMHPTRLNGSSDLHDTVNGSANGSSNGVNGRPRHLDALEGPGIVLFTSPGPGEGKTTSVANLAAAFAETGRSVLVLSCDFRRPKLANHLGVREGESGMVDVLWGGVELEEAIQETNIEGVSIVTAGGQTDNPAELLARGRPIVMAARQLADVVLVDMPPLLVANDASELIPIADAVVVVGRAGRTTVESASRAGELLERLAAPVAGVALVAAPPVPTSHRYYYRYRSSRLPLFGRSRPEVEWEYLDDDQGDDATEVDLVAAEADGGDSPRRRRRNRD